VIKAKFDLYFAVRTRESILNSDAVYTQRAKIDWTFNGTGTVDAQGAWSAGAGAGISSTSTTDPKSFAEVTSGGVVPITTGPLAVTELNNAESVQWALVDK
jgi:hypothetical protein